MANDGDDVDEDMPHIPAPKERIIFGSLEIQEKKRIESNADLVSKAGGEDKILFENLSVKTPSIDGKTIVELKEKNDKDKKSQSDVAKPSSMERFELPPDSKRAKEKQEQLIKDFMLKRRARALAVPTNDMSVRSRLRALGEPVTLFGEREMERRERLRQLMAKLDASGGLDKLVSAQEEEEEELKEKEEEEEQISKTEIFYTEGTAELLHARNEIAQFSLSRAFERIERAKRKRENAEEDEDKEAVEGISAMAKLNLECSEIGDDRPLSSCSFSPDASLLAVCSWSGSARLCNIPNMTPKLAFRAHSERATDITFHPQSCISQSATSANLATASADHTATVWSLEGSSLQQFKGHIDRLARIAFHPSGNFLATASFDKTWRLWDVETGSELLLQEGHSRPVYCVAFHTDGSLAASVGLDSHSRLWDLRTGKNIFTFHGHVKPVYGVDFSPNGYHLATCSEDNTCRIWDLRKKESVYIIPAHSSLVSQVKFEPLNGNFLATSSYDNTAKIWSCIDFKPIKSLIAHEGKIMSVSISPGKNFIATASHDRTIKLWTGHSNVHELHNSMEVET